MSRVWALFRIDVLGVTSYSTWIWMIYKIFTEFLPIHKYSLKDQKVILILLLFPSPCYCRKFYDEIDNSRKAFFGITMKIYQFTQWQSQIVYLNNWIVTYEKQMKTNCGEYHKNSLIQWTLRIRFKPEFLCIQYKMKEINISHFQYWGPTVLKISRSKQFVWRCRKEETERSSVFFFHYLGNYWLYFIPSMEGCCQTVLKRKNPFMSLPPNFSPEDQASRILFRVYRLIFGLVIGVERISKLIKEVLRIFSLFFWKSHNQEYKLLTLKKEQRSLFEKIYWRRDQIIAKKTPPKSCKLESHGSVTPIIEHP